MADLGGMFEGGATDDAEIGKLFREYRDVSKELLRVAGRLNELGFKPPEIENDKIAFTFYEIFEIEEE